MHSPHAKLTGPLPKFKNPPLVETVLGFHFTPLEGLSNAHLGVFWRELGEDWPHVNDAPLVPSEIERFGDERMWRSLGAGLRFTQSASTRVQIRNKTQTRMIQLQRDRFHYNWLRTDEAVYPHYEQVRAEFDDIRQTFERFVRKFSLGELEPIQWEVTYLNHIPKETVWSTPEDWASVFRSPVCPAGILALARIEDMRASWKFEITPRRGRLHVEIYNGRKGAATGPDALFLDLTARGGIGTRENDATSVEEGLDLGREVIVVSFRELTSDTAHTHWELLDDNSR